MKVEPVPLPGVQVITPKVFGDPRGFFFESWRADRYGEIELPAFVQDNVSRSQRGVLRGLHLQNPFLQGKLIQVLDGSVFDVAVDVRIGSPTFGGWTGHHLSGENHRQLYVPPGFAHGFCVLSESALLTYKCSEAYHPEAEFSIAWNDPAIGIDWPIENPTLSGRDAAALPLEQLSSRLPAWHP